MKAKFKKYTLQFHRPAGTSRGTYQARDSWFLFIEENGKTGIGECAPLPGLSLENPGKMNGKLEEVCLKIEYFSENIQQLKDWPSIQFGLETALLDLKNGGTQTIFSTDFTSGKRGIPINGLIWMGTPNDMQWQIREKLEQGFRCIKMKIGAIDFETELALLKNIRKQFTAKEITLRVDANCAFKANEALEKLKRLTELEIHSIEQPIATRQWETLTKLCEQSPLPIALDEELIGITNREQKAELLQTVKPAYLVLKPSLHGGIAGCDEWISLAEKNSIKWWITSYLESNIGLNAIAQWTATKPVNMEQGLGTGKLFSNNFDSPLSIVNDQLWYLPGKNWKLNLIKLKSQPHIFISGESFLLNEIAKIVSVKLQQNLKDWERDFWLFASEWSDENDFVVVKTSGSTGEPKSIQLPKMVMQKSAERTIDYFKLKKGDHLLQSLSAQYIAGKMMFVRAIVGQMNLSVVDPSTNFLFLDTEKFDFGALVPLQVSNILSTEMGTNRVENIKYLLVGGSAVPVQLENKIRQLKNNVVSTYGMTETASHIAVRTLSGSNYSENYHCLHGISIRKNEEDCLEILPEEQNKWLSTTDLVEIISPTEFKIIGRADHAIISGGLKFHPERLEQKLGKHMHFPFMITFEMDEKLGQKLILVIEAEFSIETEKEISQLIEKYLEKYESPRKIVFVDRIPRNENGKIIRR